MTAEQIQALQAFAAKHGRSWKSKLRSAWASGRDERLPNGALLRQIRNTLGPVGLAKFRSEP